MDTINLDDVTDSIRAHIEAVLRANNGLHAAGSGLWPNLRILFNEEGIESISWHERAPGSADQPAENEIRLNVGRMTDFPWIEDGMSAAEQADANAQVWQWHVDAALLGITRDVFRRWLDWAHDMPETY